MLRPQHLSELGEFSLKTARRVRPCQAAHGDLGAAVGRRDRADEDAAPPDQEGQDQPGQRGKARDQGGQLARVVRDGQADPLLVAQISDGAEATW